MDKRDNESRVPCPICGADLVVDFYQEGDTPACEHCILDIDVMFPPDNGEDEPLNIWAGGHLDRNLLIELNHALTAFVEVTARDDAGIDWQRLDSSLAELAEAAVENANVEDDSVERDFNEDASAFKDYLHALLSGCPGFYGTTDYDDDTPLCSAYHRVYWANDPTICLAAATATLRVHTSLLHKVTESATGSNSAEEEDGLFCPICRSNVGMNGPCDHLLCNYELDAFSHETKRCLLFLENSRLDEQALEHLCAAVCDYAGGTHEAYLTSTDKSAGVARKDGDKPGGALSSEQELPERLRDLLTAIRAEGFDDYEENDEEYRAPNAAVDEYLCAVLQQSPSYHGEDYWEGGMMCSRSFRTHFATNATDCAAEVHAIIRQDAERIAALPHE